VSGWDPVNPPARSRMDPWHLERQVGGGWVLRAEVRRNKENRYVFASLGILPPKTGYVPESGITSLVWRSVNIGQLLDEARQVIEDFYLMDQIEDAHHFLDETDWSRPGPVGHPDLLYARLALSYEDLASAGVRAPLKVLADQMHCSRATANTRIAEARRRGLLTAPTSGRVGGQLTPKARQLLGFAERDAEPKQPKKSPRRSGKAVEGNG
jgi:hypothetical protein